MTRERPKPPAQSGSAADEAKQDALKAASSKLGSVGREALDLAMKSQRKAGDPPPETPGASIEAYFKPIQIMVDGTAGIAADRPAACQLERALPSTCLGGGESGAGQAGARAGGSAGCEPESQRDALASAARRHDRQDRQGRRRRRQRQLDRPNRRRDGSERDRRLPTDRRQPLSVREKRSGCAAGGFRETVRADRHYRQVLFSKSRPACE